MITSRESMIAQLTAAAAATTGYLDGVTLHLFKDDFVPSPTTTLEDITAHEADFTGYAASPAIDWLLPYVTADGNGHLPGETIQFQPTGTAVPNTIYGWYMQKGAVGSGGVLVASGRLSQSRYLSGPTDALLVDPDYVYLQGAATP